ncbi:anti-sigma factor [Rhizobium sp. TRM95111]|uniref:anti-sigma factor n=1 Tax=Rhizobium alarense TaxID=2846851 RepID=UPI001F277D7D|nr:anti-sigma factor [Rhizobium alarense]MCF3639161.1 anti-sigma factor [Rhizobium alarense]
MTTPQDKEEHDSHRDEVIAGEYVLGILSAEDRRRVEARLASDRRFAARVNRWEENLSSFNDDYETIAPPSQIYAAVERRITSAGVGDAVMSGSLAGGFWNSVVFWRSVSAVSIAAAAVFAMAGSGLFSQRIGTSALVAELSGDDSAISLVARYDERAGVLRFTPVAAGAAEAKSLELWLAEGDKPPVSLGVLPESGEAALAISQDAHRRIAAGAVLAVSVEPFGGSPTGAATGPVIASGAVRAR